MATEPRMYTKNYVSSSDVISVNYGSATYQNLFDRDKDSKFITSGAASDLTSVIIDITFYEGTAAINRAIDTMVILNHNLKNYTLYYWDGTTYQTWLTVTGETSTTAAVKTLSSQSISKVRLQCDTTQIVNAEKFIGELYLCAVLLDLGQDIEPDYEVTFRERAKTLQMGDGSIQKVSIYWTPNRTAKYEASVKMRMVSAALFTSLRAIRETGTPFLWYPESIQRPDELWYVHWTNTWKYKYTSPYKNVGYDLEFKLQEV